MLKSQQHEQSQSYVYQSAADSEEFANLDQAHSDSLEDYLDQVCAPLIGIIPRNKRDEIRGRVAQRLEQFATAHRELGSSANEAIELALAQCGAPNLISNRWLQEKHISTRNQVTTTRKSLRLSERLTGSARWSTAVSTAAFGLPYLADVSKKAGEWWSTHSDNTVTYYRFCLFTVPLLAGLITGLAAKKKPVRGVVNAISVLAIPAIIAPGFICGLQYAHLVPGQSPYWEMMPNPVPAVCGLLPWMVMGCMGAALGNRVRNSGSRIISRVICALRKRNSDQRLNQSRIHMLLNSNPQGQNR